MSEFKMSPAQLERYASEDVERLEDDAMLGDWLPQAVPDLSQVEVVVVRCIDGGDEEGCENVALWQAPAAIDGEWPRCAHCDRDAHLVEVVGIRDYAYAV
jgi:hypothetical protein